MICLDSDCIIDFLKGNEAAIKAVKRHQDMLVTTEINAFEVWLGIHTAPKEQCEKESGPAKAFFDSLDVLSLDDSTGESAALISSRLIKKGDMINTNDCLISSILKKNGCTRIITRNTKHFSRVPGLNSINY